jgi:precorrin-6B methylase 2
LLTPLGYWFVVGVILLAVFIAWMLWAQLIGAAWTPTPNDVVDRMLGLAGLKEDDVLYDLGCGDGRIVIRAAKKYGVRAVGVEADVFRVTFARSMARVKGVADRVKIVRRNLFDVDLSEATVVTIFLTHKSNQRLKPKLLALPPGSRIVTHVWKFDGWEPSAADSKLKAYLYVVGESGHNLC